MSDRTPLVAVLATILVLALGARPAAAQDDEGGSATIEGAAFLLLPVGAKAVAMGRAVTALDGPESVWWNPAGLGGLTEGRVLLLRGEDLAGELTAVTSLFPKPGLGVLGLSYELTDFGEQDLTDREGNVLGTISFRNHVGVLSLATDVVRTFAMGVNLKVLSQRWTCRGSCEDAGVSSTTFALDAGVQWRQVLGLPLRLAAAVAHLGPRIQVINAGQADPLPTRIRVGVAYDVLQHFVENDELSALISVELEDRWRDPGSPATYVGAEFGAGTEQALVVRAGYVFGADLQVDGAGVGVGLRYDRLELGIGKSLASSPLSGETEPVHLTLGFVF